MGSRVTVAIPVRNGGRELLGVLEAVGSQQWTDELELLICDSGSSDGSVEAARRLGARVIEIAPADFSHGRTRNLLMRHAVGDHVAFLTQDSQPADRHWLTRLMSGFDVAEDVALTFGPYRPRADGSPMVARELTQWFASFSRDSTPRVDRLRLQERAIAVEALMGPRGYFTSANGCVARSGWERVPFREIGYAEDHALAHDMMRAGFAKAFVPAAAVIHSHDYSGWGWLQRSFDEARALHELYGYVEPLAWPSTLLKLWGLVGADWRWSAPRGLPNRGRVVPRSLLHHAARITGAALGTRAALLPAWMVPWLSLERRR